MRKNSPILPAAGAAVFLLLLADPAYAYVGPGAGLSVIGTVLALLAATGLAIAGFVWYPIKRLRRRKQRSQTPEERPRQDAHGAQRG